MKRDGRTVRVTVPLFVVLRAEQDLASVVRRELGIEPTQGELVALASLSGCVAFAQRKGQTRREAARAYSYIFTGKR